MGIQGVAWEGMLTVTCGCRWVSGDPVGGEPHEEARRTGFLEVQVPPKVHVRWFLEEVCKGELQEYVQTRESRGRVVVFLPVQFAGEGLQTSCEEDVYNS